MDPLIADTRDAPQLQQVLENVSFLRARKLTTPVEFQNVIGISGGRGVGKSTLLYLAVKALKAKAGADLVLDIIKPIDYGAACSLSSTVLAALRANLDSDLCRASDDDVKNKLESFRASLMEISFEIAQGDAKAFASIQHGATTASNYSWRVAQAEEAKYGSRRRFAKWLSEYLVFRARLLNPGDTRPLLIVPLDDFDMHPDVLPDAIAAIAHFLDGEHIATLIAFTQDALQKALSVRIAGPYLENLDKLATLGLVAEASLAREVDDFIMKVIPESLRVNLPFLESPLSKLLYRPIGAKRSLSDLLTSVEFPPQFAARNLGEYFDLSKFIVGQSPDAACFPSMYSAMLPSNARALFNLYEALQRLTIAQEHGTFCLQCQQIVELLRTFTAICSSDLLHSERQDLARIVKYLPDGRVEFDFRGLEFGRTLGLARNVYNSSRSCVRLPRIEITGSQPDTATEIEKLPSGISLVQSEHDVRIAVHTFERTFMDMQGQGECRVNKSTALTYMVAFVNEFTETDPRLVGGTFGNFSYPGGTAWDVHRVVVDDIHTDHKFLIIPDFEVYLPICIYVAVWNDWVQQLRSGWSADIPTITPLISDLLAVRHLVLLCDIQARCSVEIGKMPRSSAPDSDIKKELGNWQSVLAERLSELRTGKLQHRFMQSQAFIGWMFICGIHACSNLILSSETLNWWRDTVVRGLAECLKTALPGRYRELWIEASRRSYDMSVLPSSMIFADYLKALSVTDPTLFAEKANDLVEEWASSVRSRLMGQHSLAQRLLEQSLITKDDAKELLEKGLTPVLQAKFATLPEQVQSIISKFFPAPVNKGNSAQEGIIGSQGGGPVRPVSRSGVRPDD